MYILCTQEIFYLINVRLPLFQNVDYLEKNKQEINTLLETLHMENLSRLKNRILKSITYKTIHRYIEKDL